MENLKKRLDKSDEIAIHHGFNLTQINPVQTNKNSFLHPEEKVVVIRTLKKDMVKVKIIDPIMIYYDQPILLNKKESIFPKNHKLIGLDIVGIPNSIAEAIIINTSLKILNEEGYKNIFIDINCTGGRNSKSRFIEEYISYYKKNINALDIQCRNCLNKKNFEILNCDHEHCIAIKENAPKPINFLSEQNRQHFKEFIEYLEEMNIPYRINDNLISEGDHYSRTIFEIKTENNNKEILLGRGGRYDESANKVTNKRSLVAAGISLQFKKINNKKAYSNIIQKPRIFLIQFGFIAKLKSFEVIDLLRKYRVTVHQNLHVEKLTDQFITARKMGIPHVIIIGQKEALENEITFRNMRDASHETMKMDKLPKFLKKMGIIQM